MPSSECGRAFPNRQQSQSCTSLGIYTSQCQTPGFTGWSQSGEDDFTYGGCSRLPAQAGQSFFPARALRPWFQAEFKKSEGLKGRPFNPPDRIRRFRIPAAGRIVGTLTKVFFCCDSLFDGRCPRTVGTLAFLNERFLFAGTGGLSGLRKLQDAPVSQADGPGLEELLARLGRTNKWQDSA